LEKKMNLEFDDKSNLKDNNTARIKVVDKRIINGKTDVNQLEKEMKRKEESRKIFFPNVN